MTTLNPMSTIGTTAVVMHARRAEELRAALDLMREFTGHRLIGGEA